MTFASLLRKPFLRVAAPALAALAILPTAARALTVEPVLDPDQLADALLVNGWSPVPGSIQVSPATDFGIGFFWSGGNIGFESGVLLTTGSINNAVGPNTLPNASAGGAISSISFDFVAVSPGISWNYVFGSEEYQEYVGSQYNDLFSLSLNDVNLALIPGTTNQVAINSVNQNSNTAFYRSNVGTSLDSIDTQYDGLTTVLRASRDDLNVGQTYSVSFQISDVGDTILDSGVFIEADSVSFPGGSFETPLLPPPPATVNEPWVFPTIQVFDPGFVWWFDPDVAVGYIYNVIDPNGPLFDEYTAPILPFDSSYELATSTDSCNTFTNSLGTITGNVAFAFPTAVPCFAITGIDTANMLDPTNTNAFVAGISFDSTGQVSVTQQPIVQFVPPSTSAVPGPLPLLAVGAAFRWSRRLRSVVRQES